MCTTSLRPGIGAGTGAGNRTTPRRGPLAAAVVGAALVLVVYPRLSGSLPDVAYFGLLGATVVAAWAGVRQGGRQPAAVWLALGVTLSAAGDVLWQVQLSLTGSGTEVGPADPVYLLSYLAVGVGVTLLARGAGQQGHERLAAWIDALVVFVAALLVVWQVSIAATVVDTSLDLVSRVVLALYPAADAALIGLVVRLLATRRRGERASVVVAAACACWLVSDVAYLLLADADSVSSWLDAGWLLGSALLAAAAWPLSGGTGGDAGERSHSGLARLAVCLGALMVPPSAELFAHATGAEDAAGLVFGSMLVLTALVFVRAALLLRGESAARALVRSRERYTAKLAAHSSDAVFVVAP